MPALALAVLLREYAARRVRIAVAPEFFGRYLARNGRDQQLTAENDPEGGPTTSTRPLGETRDYGVHGSFDDLALNAAPSRRGRPARF